MNIGKRNLLAGKQFEDEIAETLNKSRLFPPLGSSQDIDQEADRRKIDIVPVKNKDYFKYNIQAKVSTNKLQYPKLLSQMNEVVPIGDVADKIPVVFHKYNTKSDKGRYMTRAKYAIMYQEDFIEVIQTLEQYKKAYNELMTYWDSLPDTEKPGINETLEKLGL